jgi:hypothetical protein
VMVASDVNVMIKVISRASFFNCSHGGNIDRSANQYE